MLYFHFFNALLVQDKCHNLKTVVWRRLGERTADISPGISVLYLNNYVDLRLLEIFELEGNDQFVFDLDCGIVWYGNAQSTQGNISDKAGLFLFNRLRSLSVRALDAHFFSIRLPEL